MISLVAQLALTPGCYLAHRIDPDGGFDGGRGDDAGVRPPGITAAVAAGFMHACALDRVGNVRCWGEGDARVLGPGSYVPTPTPISVDLGGRRAVELATGNAVNCAIGEDGAGLCWGQPFHATPVVVEDGAPFVGVAVGTVWPCLITRAGPLVCAQASLAGTDEVSTDVRVASPVQRVAAGERFHCALSDGRVICFGRNEVGELGRAPIPVLDESEPAAVEGLPRAMEVACGRQHACALAFDGGVYCWGRNVRSQLGAPGPDTHVPVRVDGLPADIVAIDAGHNNTCAVRSRGELVCWGDNDFGQLGRDDLTEALGPTVIDLPARAADVAVGASFICAVDEAADVWCWGRDDRGQLGDGTVDYYRTRPGLVRF